MWLNLGADFKGDIIWKAIKLIIGEGRMTNELWEGAKTYVIHKRGDFLV